MTTGLLRIAVTTAVAAAASVGAGGCCALAREFCPPTKPALPEADCGPFLNRIVGRDEVVAEWNRRAATVPFLRALKVAVKADVATAQGETLSATVSLMRPRYTYLEARKEIVDKRIGLGSNDEVFWFYENFSSDKAWVGRWEHLGKPGARRLPLHPESVFSLLGVTELVEDPVRGPWISVVADAEAGDYVLQVHRRRDPARPSRGVHLERTFRLSRGKLRPKSAIFHAPDGREVLRAEIRGWRDHGDDRVLPDEITLVIPIYEGDAWQQTRKDVIQFDFSEATVEFAPPAGVTGERYRALFDPAKRVEPYVKTVERIDAVYDGAGGPGAGGDGPSAGPPAPR